MALPITATADDVRGIIAYLKNKPTGATISEAVPPAGMRGTRYSTTISREEQIMGDPNPRVENLGCWTNEGMVFFKKRLFLQTR
jgi:hypothetical protein